MLTKLNTHLIPNSDITHTDFIQNFKASSVIKNYNSQIITVNRLEEIEHQFDLYLDNEPVPFVMYTTLEEQDDTLFVINALIQTEYDGIIDYAEFEKQLMHCTEDLSTEPMTVRTQLSIDRTIQTE